MEGKSVSNEEVVNAADNDSGDEGLAIQFEAVTIAESNKQSEKSDAAASKQSSRSAIDTDARVRATESEFAQGRHISAPGKLPLDRAELASKSDDLGPAIIGDNADVRRVKLGKGSSKVSSQNRISSSPERGHQLSGILVECQDLAASVLGASEKTHVILMQRSTEIRYIRRLMENREIDTILSHFASLKLGEYSQVVLLSELLAIFDTKSLGLTLDQAVGLLQIVEELSQFVRTDSDMVMISILRTMLPLLEGFADLIKQTRSTFGVGGVDISREERLRKCTICYNMLYHIRQRWEQFGHMYRNSSTVLLLMGKIEPLLLLATS